MKIFKQSISIEVNQIIYFISGNDVINFNCNDEVCRSKSFNLIHTGTIQFVY